MRTAAGACCDARRGVQEWKPWEPAALAALQPWHALWPARDWAAVTERVVTPALEAAMHELLSLNPLKPDTRPCEWLKPWWPLLPPQQLGAIYDRAFLPELHRVLHMWLTHAGVIFEEVWAWLEATKRAHLAPAATGDPRVAHHLAAAAAAVQAAQAGSALPAGYPVVSTAAFGTGPTAAAARHAQAAAVADAERELDKKSIKEFVAEAAAAAGLAWVPRTGRQVAGLQVYALGSLSVIVDIHAGVVKAFLGDRWVPMGIDEVIAQARQKQ